MTSFVQVDESLRRESLRPIALFSMEQQEFTERYGIQFRTDAADAESTLAALIELADERQYMLLRHIDAPFAGTELFAPESAHPDESLQIFLRTMDLSMNNVEWHLEDNQ